MIRIIIQIEAENSPARTEKATSVLTIRSGKANDIKVARELLGKITANVKLLANEAQNK